MMLIRGLRVVALRSAGPLIMIWVTQCFHAFCGLNVCFNCATPDLLSRVFYELKFHPNTCLQTSDQTFIHSNKANLCL